MKINGESYKISTCNYYEEEHTKKQIVIGHTNNQNMTHILSWMNRLNGDYKKTAAFTISTKGDIYQHFNPKYYSDFIGIKEMDKQIISIVLENEGWLTNSVENESFNNWLGYPYTRKNKIVKKKWRNKEFWPPYGSKQMEALVELVKHLCDEFNINFQTTKHNTIIKDIYQYSGICYRSNYSWDLLDLSPAWDFQGFDNKLAGK